MAKNVLLKVGICMAVCLIGTGTVKASTIQSEQSIAGLSYKIDQYYKVYDETISDMFADNEQSDGNMTVRTASLPEEEPKSKFENIGISIAENYVRVRAEANTESEILGKLYQGCAANILSTEGDWVKIKSGNVEGYIKSEYLAIGNAAEKIVDNYVSKVATVTTTTLKVREEQSVDSICLTLIPIDETYEVLEEHDEWVKIVIDNDIEGYVSKEFVNIEYDYQYAISIEEEQARLAAEEEARRAEAERQAELEAQRREEEQKKQQQASSNSSSNSSSSSSSSNSSSNSSSSSSSSNSSSSSSSSSSNSGSKGSQIANFAQKFVGNPYVYGGTSLTNGTDCSGFVQSVYRNYGYSLPRTSGEQSRAGSKVSLGSLQPGDIIYYDNGRTVNHVALYIGNGKVVHASNRRDGIKISKYNYRTPAGARRIVG